MRKQDIINEIVWIINDISNLYSRYNKEDIYEVGVKLAELNKRI